MAMMEQALVQERKKASIPTSTMDFENTLFTVEDLKSGEHQLKINRAGGYQSGKPSFPPPGKRKNFLCKSFSSFICCIFQPLVVSFTLSRQRNQVQRQGQRMARSTIKLEGRQGARPQKL